MKALRRSLGVRLAEESGQSVTEVAILAFALLGPGGFFLLKFAPEAIAAATIYLNGFYLVLGLPIG